MEKTAAAILARNLMNHHGVGHLEFTFIKTKTALGVCAFVMGKPVRISLSEPWVKHLPEEEVTDTILHEIAHALAGNTAGHGERWKQACRKIGANPYRLAKLDTELVQKFQEETAKYVAICTNPTCDTTVRFNRYTKAWQNGSYRCGKCRSPLLVSKRDK
jgi:predicted SprT family Zn-dependent metalloprotease